MKISYKIVILLSVSFFMIWLENYLKSYISVSALLSIIVMAIIINHKDKNEVKEIKQEYEALWNGFEILLFSLVGCQTDIHLALSKEGLVIAGLILISLIFRSIGVLLSIIKSKYNFKERLFLIISYLPKAIVQASIGGIALSEGLSCGTLVLTAAVVSILIIAPIGAILIDNLSHKLLVKDEEINE